MSDIEMFIEFIKILIIFCGFLCTVKSIDAAVKNYRDERYRASSHENLKALLSVYMELENEELLRCYGIDVAELRSKNIDPKEFVHILKDFTAGQLYYDTNFEHESGLFPKNSHRFYMCSLEITKNSYPYLKTFFGGTNYGSAMENTIASFKN